ncbi:unnamed protein product [Acanthoscelides obtectus]|uniref:Codanin-1 C-terminal domain-containing protein n=1 Tax=Acanthoscelides obtectus TaxID=200917 RepID=A0A9P0KSW7_ACAOB|nr:unnamed protein product [Acanthoscelides obtectus]CAK1660733.1 Codanin-1 [Acanthoscelides obtectus]
MDADVDAPTKKSYLECVKRLRILAKFLGFIQALPYKSDIAYNETLLATQVKIRQQQLPSLDIKCILEKSVQQNYRVLTIPWITKYLSMLDYVTLRLPYYMSCYRILFSIYKDAFKKKGDFDYNSILMKSCLGWLFELPQFPDLEYFHFCVSNYENQNSQHGSSGVDDINIIDQDILYAFCPYLDEIKKLLTSTSSKSNVTVKHITPVTAVQSFEQVHKKKFEQQLEDSFLNTQPVSMRKTIEFVSERIASACIKHICNEVVPNYKKQASESLKTFLEGWKKEQNVSDGNFNDNQKLALKAIVSKQVQNHLVVLKGNCSKEVTQIMEEKIPISVENLLAIDTLKETTNACVSLTAKMCKDRVRQWMVTQLNTNIFAKDFNMTTQKFLDQNGQNISDKPVFALPPEGNGKTHNDDLKSAADILEQIRLMSVDILENPKDVSADSLKILLQDANRTLNGRCDVNDTIAACICTTLVDLALLLIVYRTDIMPENSMIQLFISVWRCYYSNTDNLFKNLLCPRNVMLTAQGCNNEEIWTNFARFAAILVKEKVISSKNLESQCTGFYKKEWDQVTLSNVSLFLKKFAEYHKSLGGDASKFSLLIEFLSEFCEDL